MGAEELTGVKLWPLEAAAMSDSAKTIALNMYARRRRHSPEHAIVGICRCNKDVVLDSEYMAGKYAPGFGIAALEELDLEDENIYASGFEFEEDEPSQMSVDNKYKLEDKVRGTLPGFKVASSCNYNLERFHPPLVPPDFVPVHKFSSQLETVS